jgi:hypothetical protein
MDLANLRMMPLATKFRIKLLSTTYVDLDAMPVDSFPKFKAARANSAQVQSPSRWHGSNEIDIDVWTTRRQGIH